jgi:hypothetical protein
MLTDGFADVSHRSTPLLSWYCRRWLLRRYLVLDKEAHPYHAATVDGEMIQSRVIASLSSSGSRSMKRPWTDSVRKLEKLGAWLKEATKGRTGWVTSRTGPPDTRLGQWHLTRQIDLSRRHLEPKEHYHQAKPLQGRSGAQEAIGMQELTAHGIYHGG